MSDTVYRVFLDGKHVASKPTKDEAELLIASWLREWDGKFEVKECAVKRKET